jgi:hypothetical protein
MAQRDNQDKDKDKENTNVEGRHGDKAHDAFIDSLHGKHGGSEESEGAPQADSSSTTPVSGHHRLFEDRQQHDEAEKNSEANRLRR